mmetsp:Transcript_113297/g.360134  ORF Transcript_113297/g.360134 Transcript_113297/m.360134 type:complete len:271 (+) Transcript_113297:1776-2588(+)
MSSLIRFGISSMTAMALESRSSDFQPSDICWAEACIFERSCVLVSHLCASPWPLLSVLACESFDFETLVHAISEPAPSFLHTSLSCPPSRLTVQPSERINTTASPMVEQTVLSWMSYSVPKRLPLKHARPPSSMVQTLPTSEPSATLHLPMIWCRNVSLPSSNSDTFSRGMLGRLSGATPLEKTRSPSSRQERPPGSDSVPPHQRQSSSALECSSKARRALFPPGLLGPCLCLRSRPLETLLSMSDPRSEPAAPCWEQGEVSRSRLSRPR